jgi:hypothetical protein
MSKKRIILMLVVAALVVEIWWLAPYLRKPRRRPDRNRYHPTRCRLATRHVQPTAVLLMQAVKPSAQPLAFKAVRHLEVTIASTDFARKFA